MITSVNRTLGLAKSCFVNRSINWFSGPDQPSECLIQNVLPKVEFKVRGPQRRECYAQVGARRNAAWGLFDYLLQQIPRWSLKRPETARRTLMGQIEGEMHRLDSLTELLLFQFNPIVGPNTNFWSWQLYFNCAAFRAVFLSSLLLPTAAPFFLSEIIMLQQGEISGQILVFKLLTWKVCFSS